MSEINDNDDSGNDDDIVGCGQQPKLSRMVREIQAYNVSANGAKNTMSPPKDRKRVSKKPEQFNTPNLVVVPPAASSKHYGHDTTVKTMHSRLTNLSNDDGGTDGKKFKEQPVAKYFGKVRHFGSVKSHYWDYDSNKKLYSIKYDDNDEEDVSENELSNMIKLYDKEKHHDEQKRSSSEGKALKKGGYPLKKKREAGTSAKKLKQKKKKRKATFMDSRCKLHDEDGKTVITHGNYQPHKPYSYEIPYDNNTKYNYTPIAAVIFNKLVGGLFPSL